MHKTKPFFQPIEIEGDCCWEIKSRDGVLERHTPSDTYPKNTGIPYIHKISTIDCLSDAEYNIYLGTDCIGCE